MSRVRRLSYAIAEQGRRANATKQALRLRDSVLSILDEVNQNTSVSRRITKRSAFTVVLRSLQATRNLPFSLREHMAIKELSNYINLAQSNKVNALTLSNTDLLPISHPRSTRQHTLTASALRNAHSQWFADDPRITDERARIILASAFSSEVGSVEHTYYTSILSGLPQGSVPTEALLAAFGDGNSPMARSLRAQLQRRDRLGRFAYQGGGLRNLVKRAGGIFSLTGRVLMDLPDGRVQVELADGRIVALKPEKGEYIKAVLPGQSKDGYSPTPAKNVSMFDEVTDENELESFEAPNGWEKDGNNWKNEKWSVEIDENRNFKANNGEGGEVEGKGWADILDAIDDFEKVADNQPNWEEEEQKKPSGKFEFNYPDGAYKIAQGRDYDPEGRQDEDSPDFTDDPVELAQKFEPSELIDALEQAVLPQGENENAFGYGALRFGRGDELVPAEAIYKALDEAGEDADLELARIYDKGLGSDANEKALVDSRKAPEKVTAEMPDVAEAFERVVTENTPDVEPAAEVPQFEEEKRDETLLPPLLKGLTENELARFMESKDHTPHLPKNFDIADDQVPEGYNKLDPAPFQNWREVTEEDQDPSLPVGFSDNPVFLAQNVSKEELMKEFRRALEPGNEAPGYGAIKLKTDDGEEFVANIPGEAIRDALQLQGEDTNLLTTSIYAEAGNLVELNDEDAAEVMRKIMAEEEPFGRKPGIATEGEREVPTADLPNLPKPPSDKDLNDLRDGLKENDYINDGILFAKNENNPNIIEIIDDNALADPRGDIPLATIYENNTIAWRDENTRKLWEERFNDNLEQVLLAMRDDKKKAVLPKKKKKEQPEPEVIRDPSIDEVRQQNEQEPVAVYKKTIPAEVPEEYEVDALGEIPDGNAEYPKPADVAPADIGGGDGPKPPYRIRAKVKDLQPGDITVGDHFVITKIGEKVPDTGRLAIEGYYPGHVIQNTKQWIEDTEIEVIRGVNPLPEQGDLPVLSKPKMKEFGKVYKDKADNQWKLRDSEAQAAYDAAWAEYVAQAELAKKRFADPTEPSNQPHRAIVRAADLKPGDITADPKKGHFVIERVFVDDATKPGFVSVEGYYPGYGTQRKEWKVDTQIDVIRNVEAPAKGEGELHRPNKVVNGKWIPDKDPAANAEWQKKIEEAAARFDAPKDLPVVDNKEQAPEADKNIPSVVVARKPRRKQAPDAPAFQGEWAAIARRAGGDWNKFREELKDKTIVFFDFETTGADAKDGNEPWQVAGIKVRNGEIVDRINIVMNPGRSIKDTWAGKVNKDGKPNAVDLDGNPLTDDYLAQQTPQAEGMKQFLEWMGPDALIAAHYAQFDDEVARRMADKHGLNYAPAGILDTVPMARDIFKNAPDKPVGNRLGQLAEYFDVKLDRWHAADADVEALKEIYDKLIDKGIELDAGKDLFDVDARQADYEKALAEFETAKAQDDQAAADFAAAKALKDALDGKEVKVDEVIADAKNEPLPNPDDAPIEGVERRDDGVVILDFTPNAAYPKGEMRMMPRDWVLDDKNTVLLDREDARMRNILPGDFMQSKDGNIIWQVVAVRAGEDNGFQPGRVRIYRRDIETGEMNVYEHWHGTRLDGVRRPINPGDLDVPEGNPNNEFVANQKAAPEPEDNVEASQGKGIRRVVNYGDNAGVIKIEATENGIAMKADLYDKDGNKIYSVEGTYRTFAGAEAEGDALLKEFADGLRDQQRKEAAEPAEARAKDVPISRGDIPADAYDASETIEVEDMPAGLNGQISVRETGDDKPNYEVDAVVQDADGENLAEHHSEHPSKVNAEKEGRDWVARASEAIANTEAPAEEAKEPSKKKTTKPKKELPQDQKVRFSQLNEEEQAEVLRNIAEVEAMAVSMAGIRADEVKPGDFLKHRQLGHYEKVVRIERGKEWGMDRVILWVYNPIAGKEQPRPFKADSPLEFVRRVEGEGPKEKFPVGKPRGRAKRPDIKRQEDPLDKVAIREGRVAPAIDIKEDRGFFKGRDGEPILQGDVVIHADPAKAAKLGRGIVKRRVGDQVDEGKKVGGLARGGKARLDYVWVQWENEEAGNAIENDGARLVVANKLRLADANPDEVLANLKKKEWKGGVAKPNRRDVKGVQAPAPEKAQEAPKAAPELPQIVAKKTIKDANGGEFELSLVKLGDLYEGAVINKANNNIQIVVRDRNEQNARVELARAGDYIQQAANGEEAMPDLPDLDKPNAEPLPKEKVQAQAQRLRGLVDRKLGKSKEDDLREQMEQAIADKDAVAFMYNGKVRNFAPNRIWVNPQNGNINVAGFENGQLKNFTIQKMDFMPTDENGLVKDMPAEIPVAEPVNDNKKEKFNADFGNKFDNLENRDDIVAGFDDIANALPKAKNYRAPENLRRARQAVDEITSRFANGAGIDEVRDTDLDKVVRRLRRESGDALAQDMADKVEKFANELKAKRKEILDKRLAAPLPELPEPKNIDKDGLKNVLNEIIQRLPERNNAKIDAEYMAAQQRDRLKSYLSVLDKDVLDIDDLDHSDLKEVADNFRTIADDKYKNFADILDEYRTELESRGDVVVKQPLNKLNPEEVARQRIADRANEFAPSEKLQAFMADDLNLDNNPLLQPFKDELQKFFANGEPKPLAMLSPAARQALGFFVGKEIKSPNPSIPDMNVMEDVRNNLGDLAFQLRTERLAFAPNAPDLGVGDALLDMDFDEIKKLGDFLYQNRIEKSVKLKIKGQDTGFNIKVAIGEDKGVNTTYFITDRATGRKFVMKLDTMVGERGADAEIASAALNRALGNVGAYQVFRHRRRRDVVVTTWAGEMVEFAREPDRIGDTKYIRDHEAAAMNGAFIDVIGLAVMDAILINGDRHRNNLLVGKVKNFDGVNPTDDAEAIQFMAVDHGLAGAIVRGYGISPDDYINGADSDDSHRRAINIASRLVDKIGPDLYKRITDMTVQQAIQALKRERGGDIKDADLDLLIQRLELLRGIDISKWKKILKKR